MSTAHQPLDEELSASALDRRFRKPLMAFFTRRTRDPVHAEDLTQQTFLRLFQYAPSGVRSDADALVFTVASNLLRDHWRKVHGRGPERTDAIRFVDIAGLTEAPSDEVSAERALIDRERLAEALDALEALGERTRDIFILFKIRGMKHRDIAALYGISPSAVEKQIMKAALHLARTCGGR